MRAVHVHVAILAGTSAAALSARLTGRWYHCASLGNWALARGTGLELHPDSTARFAFLTLNAREDDFAGSSDLSASGKIVYVAFTGTSTGDAGGDGSVTDGYAAGGMSQTEVPLDDTTTRNGFFVYLEEGDGTTLEFEVLFEQNPRKLQLRELGLMPAQATFVPID